MIQIIFAILLSFTSIVYAQDGSTGSIDEIEGLFKEDAAEDARREERSSRDSKRKRSDSKPVKNISDLKKLETFSDIAVIQKRYLPKTERFEFFIGGGTNLNDSFFVSNGLTTRLGYYFKEKWGVEAQYSFYQNENRDVTNSLLNKGVNTEGLVSTKSFYGIDIKWNPIYGKYSYFDNKIIPFDLYFSVGIGMTQPVIGNSAAGDTSSGDDALTYRVATGQVFAMTKWMAFRWDLSWHFFNSKSTISNTGPAGQEKLYNNLFLNLGLSFFFPEANYR